MIFSHIWLIVLVTAAVVGATIVGTITAEPAYVAVVKVLARPSTPVGPVGEDMMQTRDQQRFMETQKEIIVSATVARETYNKLKSNPEFVRSFERKFGEGADGSLLRQQVTVYSRTGGVETLLSSSDIGDSYIINIEVEYDAPQFAAEIANTLAREYIARYWQLAQNEAKLASDFLNEQVIAAELELKNAEAALQNFEQENYKNLAEILNYEKGGVRIYANLTDFEAESARLDSEIAKQESIIAEARERLKAIEPYIANPKALADISESDLIGKIFFMPGDEAMTAGMTGLLDRLSSLRLNLISMRTEYKDSYKPLQFAQEEVKQAIMVVGQMIQKSMESRESAYAAAIRQRESLDRKIEEYQERLKNLAEQKNMYGSLTRAVSVAEETYRTRKLEFEAAKLAEQVGDKSAANIAVLDEAQTPTAPSRPNKTLNISLSVILGLALAFALAFIVDSWDHSFRSVYDVEKRLGLPVVAAIPITRSK
ncbi:MAG: tyrosine kinase [candidate division BRC1 bacterium ADurb.BinA364]|nr:MAG: tyrosine kinase [candidate division BRC1 bacterium ADurb.BinA364]